jgi:hypothetical protein
LNYAQARDACAAFSEIPSDGMPLLLGCAMTNMVRVIARHICSVWLGWYDCGGGVL